MQLPHRVLRAIRIWQQENRRTWKSQFQNLVDARGVEAVRRSYRDRYQESLPYAVVIAQAVGQALAEFQPRHPELNSFLRRGFLGLRCHFFKKISFGCTFAYENAEGYEQVIIAVVEEPDKKTLRQIALELQEKMRPDHKSVKESAIYYRLPYILQKILAYYGENSRTARYKYRGTVSYTALGKFGIDSHELPQTSTLTFGMGQVKDRPIVDQGQVIAAPTFQFFMSIDRRLMNGQVPALLLARICEILEKGSHLI
jgi:pyruvate/2-oxoglutarate dehydrogenase complex dihydrolipoamide acyltransferase (E2) component